MLAYYIIWVDIFAFKHIRYYNARRIQVDDAETVMYIQNAVTKIQPKHLYLDLAFGRRLQSKFFDVFTSRRYLEVTRLHVNLSIVEELFYGRNATILEYILRNLISLSSLVFLSPRWSCRTALDYKPEVFLDNMDVAECAYELAMHLSALKHICVRLRETYEPPDAFWAAFRCARAPDGSVELEGLSEVTANTL